MLVKNQDISGKKFAEELSAYLSRMLHTHIRVSELDEPWGMPIFMEKVYAFYESSINERLCIFLHPRAEHEIETPATVSKHINALKHPKKNDAIIIYAPWSLSLHNRRRLAERGVPFVVPENQLYIPQLAMDLREHFRKFRIRDSNYLSPVAQAVLFLHLLEMDEGAKTPSAIAAKLGYSPMSIGRAFEDLASSEIADVAKSGRERRIEFKGKGFELYKIAEDMLISPVRATKFVRRLKPLHEPLKYGGETALANLTDLSHPRLETYAVAASHWKWLVHQDNITETFPDEADCIIETWAYDPDSLSRKENVDILSLNAQFRKHDDPRIAIAIEQMLGRLRW